MNDLTTGSYRIVWVHGIGNPPVGYSNSWRDAFNRYLKFPKDDYIEVLWATAYDHEKPFTLEGDSLYRYRALATILRARGSAVARAAVPPLVGEWSQLEADLTAFPHWVLKPEDYIGEFIKYLVDEPIRQAVKNKLKEKLLPLVGQDDTVSIIAHSWGTVVAYESLIDLVGECPTFHLANLFTLGSPLWLVQQLLHERSGCKPNNTERWVNIHAQGDVIGSWLKPGFQVDEDFGVFDFSHGRDPHGSYFLPGNAEVQETIVKATIERAL